MTPPARRLPLHVTSITDVAERQLCTGCGVCAYVQPEDIHMVDDVTAGRRPVVRTADTAGARPSTDTALAVCPGVGLSHGTLPDDTIGELRTDWGPVLELWEGHASDPETRWRASSGGAATALALHGLQRRGMHGVLHIRARQDAPYLNETVLSRTRDELLSATGSRYAPASPCDGLDLVVAADGPCVMIGKPCDIAGASRAAAQDDRLDAKLGLTIAVFCAGTPTLQGTFEMLGAMGVNDLDRVVSIRYRGNGWPGDATVTLRTPDGIEERHLSYEASWGGILQRHRQWRCYVCADHTGEFADIAVGDPWYREIAPGEPGESLILARTVRGREFLREAIESGVLDASPVPPDHLPASQPGLRSVRGAVWGRVATSRALGIPAPVYEGVATWPAWVHELSITDKLRSTLGLARRVRRKGLRRTHPVNPRESS